MTDEQRTEATRQLILDHLAIATPEQRHVYVAYSNYDDNDYGVRFLAQSPELAVGTAIMLFWFLGADYLCRVPADELQSYQKDKLELARLIERRVLEGFYRSGLIAYDPATCIVRPDEYASMGPLQQPIAAQMYTATQGEAYVDLDEAAESYDDGLPEGVAEAVWAIWED